MSFRVRGKLAVAFGVVLVCMLATALVAWMERDRLLKDANRLYQEGVMVTEALGQAEVQLHSVRALVFRHIATAGDLAELASTEESIEFESQRFFQALSRAERGLAKDDPRHAKIEQVRRLYSEVRQLRRSKLVPLSREGNDQAALEVANSEVQPALEQTIDKLNELIESQMASSAQTHAKARDALVFTANASLWGSLMAALVGAVAAWWLSSSISGRISELAKVARSFGQGELKQRAVVAKADEITDLSSTFNRMADELERMVDQQKAIAERQSAEAQALTGQAERYGSFLDRVAGGDLTAQVVIEGGAELAKLGHNLNAMAAGLRSMTLRVHETVGALSSGSAEIMATSQQHAASAAESAAAVAETVATVEEVSQAAQQMTETAVGVQSPAQQSRRVAKSGLEAVKRTTDAMAQVRKQVGAIADGILALSEHAQTVGHIITTVNELAEQSNLLALNASIEATRAGEDGRAFAIVAQEIRALADQSKQATAQVRTILGTIQKATSAAVLATEAGQKTVASAESTVADAGSTIKQLAEVLEQTSSAADRILSAAEQQAQGVHQISEAMRSIDGAVRQTAESTRHIETAATDLNSLSGKLQHAVAQYRI